MHLAPNVKISKFFLISICLLAFTQPCSANTGIPMLLILWPPLLGALIPVIFIEAWILIKYLPLSYRKAVCISACTNSLSTIIGVPIVWRILLSIEFITTTGRAYGALGTWKGIFIGAVLQAPWLVPYESELYWMIPVAAGILIIFFFFSSWLVEAFLSYYFLKKEYPYPQVNKAVLIANAWSYVLIVVVTGLYLMELNG